MMICDDGTGLAPEVKSGLGMFNMRERAAIIDARLEISNRMPQGTDVLVEVPLR